MRVNGSYGMAYVAQANRNAATPRKVSGPDDKPAQQNNTGKERQQQKRHPLRLLPNDLTA